MPLEPGSRLGPYEIVTLLGAGGMGEVYRARDTRLERDVALKVLPARLSKEPEILRRFEQEARAASRLNHPNVVTIHDVGADRGTTYIAMELVEGESLRTELDRGPIPVPRALDLARQIAEGLARAHAAGILHRDLKPENVMVTMDGAAKILDFGLAKLAALPDPNLSHQPTVASPDTAAGTILGTFGYMAPEQARGLAVDESSDLFSFGAILYEMLTGRRAFTGATALDTLNAVLHAEPADLASRVPGVPPGVSTILRRALAKDPVRRLRSAHDLALELRGLRDAPARPRRGTRKKAVESVAVLPFVNASDDAEAQYASDGMTESIIHSLSQLPRLRVMASGTTFRHRGRDPIESGRELGVDAVLHGRLTEGRGRLRISAELVEVATGFRIWGDLYERPAADLLGVHDELAREICERLRPRLTGAERKRLARTPTRDPEAFRAYLKGRFFWNKWTPENLRAAIGLYEQAIAIDPTYALAWAGVADSWSVLGNIKAVAPGESFPKARAAAERALEIDPNLAEAHAALGFVRRLFDWDWPRAEASFRRAIECNPSYATAHRWYGQHLSGLARHEEAIAEGLRALELDPLSLIIHTSVGDVLFYARRYREAVGYYRRALDMDPDFLAGRSDLARALEYAGDVEEAIREYQAAISLAGPGAADPSVGLANACAIAGRRDDALAVLGELQAGRAKSYVSAWGVASIYARLSERGAALDWLERAYAEHDSTLVWLKVHPRFDALRQEPRFQALLTKMNLRLARS